MHATFEKWLTFFEREKKIQITRENMITQRLETPLTVVYKHLSVTFLFYFFFFLEKKVNAALVEEITSLRQQFRIIFTIRRYFFSERLKLLFFKSLILIYFVFPSLGINVGKIFYR